MNKTKTALLALLIALLIGIPAAWQLHGNQELRRENASLQNRVRLLEQEKAEMAVSVSAESDPFPPAPGRRGKIITRFSTNAVMVVRGDDETTADEPRKVYQVQVKPTPGLAAGGPPSTPARVRAKRQASGDVILETGGVGIGSDAGGSGVRATEQAPKP